MADTHAPPARERDADRTREAVLDAAERLFAERGYEATSLQDVGTAAGVSRGTPSYFYGSKEALHRAVLARSFARVRAAAEEGRARALRSGEPPEVVLAGAVGEYFDFIASHPHFVRLLEWEALTGAQRLADLPPHVAAIRETVAAIAEELGLGDDRDEAMQLVLSIIGLCWFPFVHADTVLRPLGVAAADPAFREARRRHVIELVVQGARRRLLPSPTPNRASVP